MQDGGSPSRSISGILTVNVMDTLDLAPIFNESVYSFDVTEGSYTNVRQLAGTGTYWGREISADILYWYMEIIYIQD